MNRESSTAETVTGLLVLCLIGAQTWIVVQDATQGEAGRWAVRCWQRRIRPAVIRLVLWIDAKAVIDRMIATEVDPLLNGET